MILARIDRWIGSTLFVPLIVKLCQRTGQSQHAVSRLFWFIAALDGLYRAETLFAAILFGAMSVVMMLTASLRADWPTRSSMWFRLLALVFLALDVAHGWATGRWAGVEFWVIVLAAEYAASIRTIPPSEAEKRKRAARPAAAPPGSRRSARSKALLARARAPRAGRYEQAA